MKKIGKLILLLAVVGIATVSFVACGDDDDNTNYIKTYGYSISVQDIQADYVELSELKSALAGIVTNNYLQTRNDEQMKSAFEKVANSMKSKITKSVYLKATLYCDVADPTPGAEKNLEELKTIEFGRALTKPYVFYGYETNQAEAWAALEKQKDTLSEAVYKASRKTLLNLIGKSNTTSSSSSTEAGYSSTTSLSKTLSHFESFFNKTEEGFIGFVEQNGQVEARIKQYCDSIARSHANDTLTVEAKVSIVAKELLKQTKTQVWTKTFQPTIKIK